MAETTATYVSSSQFTIDGDQTAETTTSRKVRLYQGVDGQSDVAITTSSYSAGPDTTTVTVSPASVTSNLTGVQVAASDRNTIPDHDHVTYGGAIPAADMSAAEVTAAESILPSAGDDNKLIQVAASEDSFEMVTLQGTTDQITITEGANTKTWALASAITTAIGNALVNSADAIGAAITGASGKTTPVDADEIPISDSADTNDLKKVTWANIKATLKTYFDAVYAAITHASTHIDGAADAIDGDRVEVTWTPTYYTRDGTTPSETDADDQLTAHLRGIDVSLGALASGASGSTTGTAGENLSEGDPVYGKTSDGKFWKAQQDSSVDEADAFGIVTESGGILADATGEITLFGVVTVSSWSWTSPYLKDIWLGPDYDLVEALPASNYKKPLGKTLDSNTILWFPQTGWTDALDPEPYVADPSGGATVDTECRAMAVQLRDVMQTFGMIGTSTTTSTTTTTTTTTSTSTTTTSTTTTTTTTT